MNSSKLKNNNRVAKDYHNFRQRIGRLKRRESKLRGSQKKLAELILLVCDKSKDDPHFDLEKLKWLLFYIDMESFRETGKTVTGCTYIKTV